MHYRYRAHDGGEECRFHRSPLPTDVRNGLPACHPWCLRPRLHQYSGCKEEGCSFREYFCSESYRGLRFEHIIALNPEAILLSPFENSGGYGKLDKLHVPIIEAADYMESSPLGRAEWMKFYGMLFKKDGNAPKTALAVSCEPKADSLFAKIEKEYLKLKAEAAGYPKGLSILTERKTGNVWYVPGGQSTIGILLEDANARYIFEDDEHSGSLAMSPEQILAKGKQVDVWAFKYFGGAPLSQAQLLQEYDGYKALAAYSAEGCQRPLYLRGR